MKGASWSVPLVLLLLVPTARAETKVYQYDQYDPDVAVAAAQVAGLPLASRPGFTKGEAFGQLYRPDPADFPMKILGVDMVLAAPPKAPALSTQAVIEVWTDISDGADPGHPDPAFAISTADLVDPATGKKGLALAGGVPISIDFDWGTPGGHPAEITEGTVRVVVRFAEDSTDLQSEWDTVQCQTAPLVACGCQRVGALLDPSVTMKANIVHVLQVGCSGAASKWKFAEEPALVATGDFVLRMRAEVAGGCIPLCAGRECGPDGCGAACGTCPADHECVDGKCACQADCVGKECGDDGCGGSCGLCAGGETCVQGSCEPPVGPEPEPSAEVAGDEGEPPAADEPDIAEAAATDAADVDEAGPDPVVSAGGGCSAGPRGCATVALVAALAALAATLPRGQWGNRRVDSGRVLAWRRRP